MIPDCRTCGACCRGWVVDVLPSDPVPDRLTKEVAPYGRMMRERGIGVGARAVKNAGCGTCIALRGTIGKSVTCSIYEKRPEVCRSFESGSHDCHFARAREKVESWDEFRRLELTRQLQAAGLPTP